MKRLLLIIDMQKAFINENTKWLIRKVENLVNNGRYDEVIFTRFINKEDSIFTKNLNYYGCILDDKELVIDSRLYKVLDKEIYTAFNDELKDIIVENGIDEIHICGIDTECCILKTAFDFFENGYSIKVLKDYCACTLGSARHDNAIAILERNIGKNNVC